MRGAPVRATRRTTPLRARRPRLTAGTEGRRGLTALARGLSAPKGCVDTDLTAPAPATISLLGGIPSPEALPAEAIGQASAQPWQGLDDGVACLPSSPVRGSAAVCDWVWAAKREGRASTRPGTARDRQPHVQARIERYACRSIRRRVFPRREFRLWAKAASLFVGFVSAGWFDVLDNNGTDGGAAPGGRPDFCSVLVK
ncbi:hypothetical protein GCM10011578_053620 [Streptomyces fuscichromogenes]|uniref:Uncharacterized protein n=1 Tax=Streptomyces fuscichromogenes TaxID=1324013 RepID=A0A917XFZ3_9ACTN|nr:hypothetical protein GCM10011578_053620 [Streptomyces fuscichromogenes]